MLHLPIKACQIVASTVAYLYLTTSPVLLLLQHLLMVFCFIQVKRNAKLFGVDQVQVRRRSTEGGNAPAN